MSNYNEFQSVQNEGGSYAQKLYQLLMSATYGKKEYKHRDLDENMAMVDFLCADYWKPRYLLNHNTKCAYEFMDENARLVGVEDSDIDWDSLKGISKEYLGLIKTRSAIYPTFIRRFENGVAEVEWQLSPDGRYWMDEDGFGMTSDDEFNIYGFIDTECNVVVPYQAISDYKQLRKMKAEAEKIVASR